jgi:hypothetical protein
MANIKANKIDEEVFLLCPMPMVMVVKFNHCEPLHVLHVPFLLPSSWSRLHQPFSPSAPNFR